MIWKYIKNHESYLSYCNNIWKIKFVRTIYLVSTIFISILISANWNIAISNETINLESLLEHSYVSILDKFYDLPASILIDKLKSVPYPASDTLREPATQEIRRVFKLGENFNTVREKLESQGFKHTGTSALGEITSSEFRKIRPLRIPYHLNYDLKAIKDGLVKPEQRYWPCYWYIYLKFRDDSLVVSDVIFECAVI